MAASTEDIEAELESLALQDKLHAFDIHTKSNLNPPLDRLPRLSEDVKRFLESQGEEPEAVVKKSAIKPVRTDTSHPYTDYFISSSHNTYLLAAQILGKSSAEAYTHVLNRGCRCVEIDVWPSKSGPIVTHGYTLSASVPFAKVCKAIGSYMDKTYGPYQPKGGLFSKNYQPGYLPPSASNPTPQPGLAQTATSDQDRATLDFPVFVSLECHVPPSGQDELVTIMKETWGPRLVDGPIEGIDDDKVTPKDLKGRLLVMVEYYPPLIDLGPTPGEDQEEKEKKSWWRWGANSRDSSDEDSDGGQLSSEDEETYSLYKQDGAPGADKEVWPGRRPTPPGGEKEDEGKPKPSSKIIDELASLGYYARSIKPGKGWLSELFSDPRHVLVNISETASSRLLSAISAHKSHEHSSDHEPHKHQHSHILHLPSSLAALIHHASFHLRRIYPKGTRISSTNLDPSQHWRTGAQVVALNWQRYDRGMQMQEGLFVGTPGWVLKPEILRRQPDGYAPPPSKKCRLRGRIIGASALPPPNGRHGKSFNSYIKAELYYHYDTTPSFLSKLRGTVGEMDESVEATRSKPSLEEVILKWKSKSIKVTHDPDKGGDALWDEEWEWEYETDDLAFIRLLIYEDEFGKDDRVVSFCTPVNRLVTDEWVAVRMLDKKGKDVGATVLARFTLEELRHET